MITAAATAASAAAVSSQISIEFAYIEHATASFYLTIANLWAILAG